MDHPHISVLSDYLRNLLPPGERATAEAHVQHCAECRATLDQFRAIQQFAAEEIRFTPPSPLVEWAKQAFGGTPSADTVDTAPLRLVFDSYAIAGASGLRAAEPAERRLTFESGPWRLDLAVEKPYGTAETSIVGQLVGSGRSNPAAARIQARNGKKIVKQTTTNLSGEFSLSFVARKKSVVEIAPGDGPLLTIPAQYFLE